MNDQPRFYSPHATDLADNLRRLADAIDYGRIPAPYGVYVGIHYVDERSADGSINRRLVSVTDARRAMTLSPGGWSKLYTGDSVGFSKAIGSDYMSRVTVTMYSNREEVCTRVQTGTRHVEAVEAHDEPVFEWRCADTPDDSGRETFHDTGVELRADDGEAAVFADEDAAEHDSENGDES